MYGLSPRSISASRTGAIDTTAQFTMWIADFVGDTLREAYATARLEFVNNPPPPPEGCSIDGELYADLHTEQGVARATIYSGTLTGPQLIRLYFWRDEARQDSVTIALIRFQVTPGSPGERTGHIEYDLSPSRISVPGVGALDTTAQFTLWVADDEGDTLRDVYAIAELNLSTVSPPPWGCTIDGEWYKELHTELGVARATVYSGTRAGRKTFTITYWLYESPQDATAELLSLQVTPGPPESIDLDIHVSRSEREYYYWIYPSVRLYDRYRNKIEEADRISYTYVPPDVTVETGSLNYGGELEWNWQPGSDVSVTAEVESHNVLLRTERTVRIPENVPRLNFTPDRHEIDLDYRETGTVRSLPAK